MGKIVTGEGYVGGFSGAGNVLFIDPSAGYVGRQSIHYWVVHFYVDLCNFSSYIMVPYKVKKESNIKSKMEQRSKRLN